MVKKREKNKIFYLIKVYFSNKLLLTVILVYILIMLSIINWGIPGQSHPFAYHMDEWHQMQSVRAVFKYHTANVAGAAHGPMFHFLISGLFLLPFIATHLINPFVIKNSTSLLLMQTRIFEVLRLETILFGVLSIISLSLILKKHFKINSFIPILIFVFTPIWLSLSNYFKYDIALCFWIILSLFFILEYSDKPSLKKFVLAGIVAGLTISTKISGLPIALSFIAAFFLFQKGKKQNLKILLFGFFSMVTTVVTVGIPDVVFRTGKGNGYSEFLYDNFVKFPSTFSNYRLGMSYWWYLLTREFPALFGHFLYFSFLLSLIYLLYLGYKSFRTNNPAVDKKEFFIFYTLTFFLLSLFSIREGAGGNRLLVLLPFFVMIPSFLFNKSILEFGKKKKFILVCLIIFLIFQVTESIAWVSVKWSKDPRVSSSDWMIKNIKEDATIGIENIPIYQELPDLIVKEFYSNEYSSSVENHFKYKIISSSSTDIPKIVIITNGEEEQEFQFQTAKNDLTQRLRNDDYKPIISFYPNLDFYIKFYDSGDFYMTALNATPSTITVYKKE